jgi:hypothetical protein
MRVEKPSLTLFLGAGFSEGVRLPSTSDLTKLVRELDQAEQQQPFMNPRAPMSSAFWKMASGYYSDPNFETVLHLVESAYGAFMQLMPQWAGFVENGTQRYQIPLFQEFYDAAIQAIAVNLLYSLEAASEKIETVVRPFIQALVERFEVTIVTLNYDDIIERCLPSWRDGFNPEGLFDPESLMHSGSGPLIIHLHGSVRFYSYAPQSPFQSPGPDWKPTPISERIRRAGDPNNLSGLNRTVQVSGTAQSGDHILISPMISGLRKLDKTIVNPFGYYQHFFRDALLKSPRLLTIGYGGRDIYVSAQLVDMPRLHKDRLRAVFVTRPDADMGVPAMVLGLSEQDVERDKQLLRSNFHTDTGAVYAGGFPLEEAEQEKIFDLLSEKVDD